MLCRFYEWKKDGAKKQPYYIHFNDQRPLVFAALYDYWENSEGKRILSDLTLESTLAFEASMRISSVFCRLHHFSTGSGWIFIN